MPDRLRHGAWRTNLWRGRLCRLDAGGTPAPQTGTRPRTCIVSVPVFVIGLSAFIAILPAVARADAGAVRASKRNETCQVTVFTDPTPLRAGPVDVSVLVLDAATGQPVLDRQIDIEFAPRGRSSDKIRLTTTSAAASNKLFQAAHFDLPQAGWWSFTVVVRRPADTMELHFELEAGDSPPPWRSLWLWFFWPFFVVALFAMSRLCR